MKFKVDTLVEVPVLVSLEIEAKDHAEAMAIAWGETDDFWESNLWQNGDTEVLWCDAEQKTEVEVKKYER